MKKTNLLKGALSVLAVSVLLASCTQVDSRIDTVDTLETPSVKAVAYPGVNYISWNAVKGAANYKVTRTVDGGVEDTLVPDTSALYFIDNTLSVNDVDVEYKVYALSNTNPSRAVYVYDSNAGSASVTNIFPPVGTKAIDLPKYEKDSGWNFDEGADNSNWKDDFIPTAENIKVQLVDGAIHVTAPTKAYLSTRVVGYTGNKEEIFYYDDYPTRKETEFNKYQNKTLSKKSVITSAGEYKFKATVNALGERYRNAYYGETIFALNTTITIPEVKPSKHTGNITVKYIDDAQTIARVQFEPAVSLDGKEVFAVTDYKVYRAVNGTSNLEEVTGLKADSITSSGKTTVVYVVDDTVPANNVEYDYYVVLSKDKEFESGIKPVILNKAEFNNLTDGGYVSSYCYIDADDDKNSNDVVVKVSPYYGNKIVSVAYAFSTSSDVNKVLDSAYTALTVEPAIADKEEQPFLIKDVPENNYVIVKAEFAEKVSTGKANKVVATSITQYTLGQANNVNLQIAPLTQQPGDKDLLKNDLIGNLINVNGGELVSVKYAAAKDPELAKVAAVSGKPITFTVKDYNEGEGSWDKFDYKFDIPNAGKVGEYIAIAVEVKAKEGNAKNSIIVKATANTVTVSDERKIVSNARPDTDTKGTEVTNSLNVYLSKDICKKTNKIDNYDSVEISYIATDSSYQIDENAEWKKIDPIKVTSFESEPKTGYDYIHRKVNITTQTYDSAKTYTSKTDYYVIKVVTKYNVPGAKEDENYLKSSFSYAVNK